MTGNASDMDQVLANGSALSSLKNEEDDERSSNALSNQSLNICMPPPKSTLVSNYFEHILHAVKVLEKRCLCCYF